MNGYTTRVEKLIDNSFEKFYRIQASLATNIDLRNYPFDKHSLPIQIEDRTNTSDSLIYKFNATDSGMDPEVTLVGWQLDGYNATISPHEYSVYNQTFTRLIFNIEISRHKITAGIKFFLPVALIVIVALLSMLFKADRISNRITVNSTMILAAVLLHLRLESDIPASAYLTFADEFMILTYGILILVLISTVMLAFHTTRKDHEQADKIYRYSLVIIPIITICSYALLFASLKA
jgi:hypothetical protein